MDHIRRAFARLGFEVDAEAVPDFRWGQQRVPYQVTVTNTRNNTERFLVRLDERLEAQVLDVRSDARALLLMIKDPVRPKGDANPVKMLLGHDERQLFVAATSRSAVGVEDAMEALKPDEVVRAERNARVKGKNRQKRRNKGRIRQGDFFFVPKPEMIVPEELVQRDEPINRGRGSSHFVEYLYRSGGRDVWVCRNHPNGVTPAEYQNLLRQNPEARKWAWRIAMTNMDTFAKGRITHDEHATIVLDVWHKVIANTEGRFRPWETVAFID